MEGRQIERNKVRKISSSNCSSTTKMNVITPLGSHILPNTESCELSPLLDRGRLGGGCDCGGWDMGCHLLVSGNSNIRYSEEHLLSGLWNFSFRLASFVAIILDCICFIYPKLRVRYSFLGRPKLLV